MFFKFQKSFLKTKTFSPFSQKSFFFFVAKKETKKRPTAEKICKIQLLAAGKFKTRAAQTIEFSSAARKEFWAILFGCRDFGRADFGIFKMFFESFFPEKHFQFSKIISKKIFQFLKNI